LIAAEASHEAVKLWQAAGAGIIQPCRQYVRVALAEQRREAFGQTEGQTSLRAEIKQPVQCVVLGVGPIGRAAEPDAGHASRTGWTTDQSP
jgi:hypothetical protein